MVVVPTNAGPEVVVMRSAGSPPLESIWRLAPEPVENGADHAVPGKAPSKSSVNSAGEGEPEPPPLPPPESLLLPLPQAGIASAAKRRRNA
jgi:hypothetical protein